jgi:predicted choloylglycine hydrolase
LGYGRSSFKAAILNYSYNKKVVTMKKYMLISVIGLALTSGLIGKAKAKEPDPQLFKKLETIQVVQKGNRKIFDKGYIEKRDYIRVAKFRGSPFEMGYQQGKLLKGEIIGNIQTDKISSLFQGSRREKTVNYLKALEQIISSRYLMEMKGLAAGSGIDYDTIFAFNVNIELWLGTLRVGCTNAAANKEATVSGKTIHMRTLDAHVSDYSMIVSFYEFDDEISFCSIVPPGYVGVFSGMNDQGIAISDNLNAGIKKFDEKGMPLLFFRRMILEKSKSIDDVDDMMKNVGVAIPNNIMVTDGKKKDVRVYEVVPGNFKKKHPKKDIICSVNKESPKRDRFTTKYLKKRRGKLEVKDFIELAREKALSEYSGSRGRIKSLSTVIFTPEDFNFWVAIRARGDKTPSSHNRFIGFNLLEEMGKGAPSIKPVDFSAK